MEERIHGRDHLQVGQLLNNLASLQIDQGAFSDASKTIERAIDIYVRYLPPDDPRMTKALDKRHRISLALSQ